MNQHVLFADPGNTAPGNVNHTIHELGHSYGWQHCNYWSPIPQAKEHNLGDGYDGMGGGINLQPTEELLSFGAWHKHRAGWLAGSVASVSQPGTTRITLFPIGPDSTVMNGSPRAIRVPLPNIAQDYWVYWRSATSKGNAGLGPVVSRSSRSNIGRMLLMDANPGSTQTLVGDLEDVAAAPPGGATSRIFLDPDTGFSVTHRGFDDITGAMKLDLVTSGGEEHTPVIEIEAVHGGTTTSIEPLNVATGLVEYRVRTFDPNPALPHTNGSGIATVQVELWRRDAEFDDYVRDLARPLIPPSLAEINGAVSGTPIANAFFIVADYTPPPSHFIVSTDTIDAVNAPYALVVEATAVSGARNTVWLPHIIDNRPHVACP
ncbi:MAG: hypothetical protein AAF628_20535 [Planctomycetota bacterium]